MQKEENHNLVLFRSRRCQEVVPATDACWAEQTCGNLRDCWDSTGSTIALTLTTYDERSGIIYDSDIELNASGFVFTTVSSPPCAQPIGSKTPNCVATDVQNTMTHELGHLIGLDHTWLSSSVMYPQAPSGEVSKRVIDSGSRDFVCRTYPKGLPSQSCLTPALDASSPRDTAFVLGRQASGCSTTGGAPWLSALAALTCSGGGAGERAHDAPARGDGVRGALSRRASRRGAAVPPDPGGGPSLLCLLARARVRLPPGRGGQHPHPGGLRVRGHRGSVESWRAVSSTCSDYTFRRGPDIEHPFVGYDEKSDVNENVITFREQDCNDVVPPGDRCIQDKTCGNLYSCWGHGGGILGLTTTTYGLGSGKIFDADIELNAAPAGRGFLFTTVDSPPCDGSQTSGCVSADVQNTVTHELGHVVGLDHVPEQPGSTMEPSAFPGETNKRIIDVGSIAGFCDAYPGDSRPPSAARTRSSAAASRRFPTSPGPGARRRRRPAARGGAARRVGTPSAARAHARPVSPGRGPRTPAAARRRAFLSGRGEAPAG
ncbi:myxosortase-dependent metalloprotease, MXAN_2677/MXAN_2678 family [Cystobacter fuscus]